MTSEMLQPDKKRQLQEEIKDLQTALVQCQNEVSHLKHLLQEKTTEIKKAAKRRRVGVLAYNHVMNKLNVAQAALEESTNKCEALEKNHQAQLEENLQLYQRELEENKERFRRELSDETEKLKKELLDREEAFKSDLSEKEKAFQNTLQGLSEQWEARERERAGGDAPEHGERRSGRASAQHRKYSEEKEEEDLEGLEVEGLETV